ncbi:hypothetical protein PpBr36_04440 [Pyricularia pennisetigena]|uniref:hypothetical protein n=1 Tax=Pyricularia pennisetigena TaxID=1578925 RepID=UPI00114E1993|nr:hypothetical protein PpBr36_04440 [Pyricularia pennisetigena]TLS26616.1 hypothetical protein PpBr36_04440 [Pyricularia pennisetigena]
MHSEPHLSAGDFETRSSMTLILYTPPGASIKRQRLPQRLAPKVIQAVHPGRPVVATPRLDAADVADAVRVHGDLEGPVHVKGKVVEAVRVEDALAPKLCRAGSQVRRIHHALRAREDAKVVKVVGGVDVHLVREAAAEAKARKGAARG